MGGGISGLSSAFYLTKRFPKSIIHLYEGSSRLGGAIVTGHLENGYLYEKGPKTIRNSNFTESVLEIIKEIGLENESFIIDNKSPRIFI